MHPEAAKKISEKIVNIGGRSFSEIIEVAKTEWGIDLNREGIMSLYYLTEPKFTL